MTESPPPKDSDEPDVNEGKVTPPPPEAPQVGSLLYCFLEVSLVWHLILCFGYDGGTNPYIR